MESITPCGAWFLVPDLGNVKLRNEVVVLRHKALRFGVICYNSNI